jgi:type IV fimbrial biogenesis protein FimT
MCNRLAKIQRGFTLIELMVVLAIIVVVMGIAAPSFRSSTENLRLVSHTNALLNTFTFARSEAIMRGTPVTVCASQDGTSCVASYVWNTGWIVFPDPNMNKTVTTILRRQPALSGTNSIQSSSSTSAVTFNGDGFAANLPAATVTFTIRTTPLDDKTTRCVAVTKTGRLTAQAKGVENCV